MSAAVTALLADQTRDDVRTKAMALVGASIGLMFAVSLVAAPLLAAHIGLSGLFAVTGALALACIAVVAWWTPPEPAEHKQRAARPPGRRAARIPACCGWTSACSCCTRCSWRCGWRSRRCWCRPAWPRQDHWHGLPAGGAGLLRRDGRTLFPLERRGYLRAVFLAAVGLVALVQLGLLLVAPHPGVAALAALLFLFFCGFNVLEATPAQPGLAHGAAACARRGAGCVQHPAIAGLLCRRRGRRLAGQERWHAGAVRRLRRADAGVAGGGLADAGARAAGRRAEEVLADEAQAT